MQIRSSLPIPDSSELARTQTNLAILLVARGDLAGAKALYDESLAALRALTGEHSRAIATVLFQVGSLLDRQGDLDGAESKYREALATYAKLLSDDHPATATALGALGHVLNLKHGFVEAADLCARAVVARRHRADDEVLLAGALFDLGVAHEGSGKLDEAQAAFAEAAALYAKHGEPHLWIGIALHRQGRALLAAKQFAPAATALEASVDHLRNVEEPGDKPVIELAKTLYDLGDARGGESQFDAAAVAYAEAAALYAKFPGEAQGSAAAALQLEGRALFSAGRFAEAATVLEAGAEIMRQLNGPGDPGTVAIMKLLIRALESANQSNKAAEYRDRLAEQGIK